MRAREPLVGGRRRRRRPAPARSRRAAARAPHRRARGASRRERQASWPAARRRRRSPRTCTWPPRASIGELGDRGARGQLLLDRTSSRRTRGERHAGVDERLHRAQRGRDHGTTAAPAPCPASRRARRGCSCAPPTRAARSAAPRAAPSSSSTRAPSFVCTAYGCRVASIHAATVGGDVGQHLGVGSSRAHEHVEAVIGAAITWSSRARPSSATTGRSSARSASSSRSPCTNSSGPGRVREVLGALDARLVRRVQRKPEEHDAAQVGERLFRVRARVIRPPNDLPPANRGGRARRAAAVHAARTAASATAGDPGAPCRPPCTETPSAGSRSRAASAPAMPAMNAWRIPRPRRAEHVERARPRGRTARGRDDRRTEAASTACHRTRLRRGGGGGANTQRGAEHRGERAVELAAIEPHAVIGALLEIGTRARRSPSSRRRRGHGRRGEPSLCSSNSSTASRAGGRAASRGNRR